MLSPSSAFARGSAGGARDLWRGGGLDPARVREDLPYDNKLYPVAHDRLQRH